MSTELGNRVREARLRIKMSQADLAERIGMSQQGVASIEKGRSINPGRIIELADALGVSPQWLQHGRDRPSLDQSSALPNASAPFAVPKLSGQRIPVYGIAIGGDDGRFVFNGEVIDMVICPPGLENVPGAYAVYVSGDSMEPRFSPGDILWVHPNRPPRKGDNVVVQLHPREEGGDREGYVKSFVGWTPKKLVLHQFNPDTDIEFERATVASIHVVVFMQMA